MKPLTVERCAPEDTPVPVEGYELEETDERVREIGRYWTWGGARRAQRAHPPMTPSYHTRIERHGRFDWRVGAYQNKMVSK